MAPIAAQRRRRPIYAIGVCARRDEPVDNKDGTANPYRIDDLGQYTFEDGRPLLLNHRGNFPIGRALFCRVSGDGQLLVCLAVITDASLLDLVDRLHCNRLVDDKESAAAAGAILPPSSSAVLAQRTTCLQQILSEYSLGTRDVVVEEVSLVSLGQRVGCAVIYVESEAEAIRRFGTRFGCSLVPSQPNSDTAAITYAVLDASQLACSLLAMTARARRNMARSTEDRDKLLADYGADVEVLLARRHDTIAAAEEEEMVVVVADTAADAAVDDVAVVVVEDPPPPPPAEPSEPIDDISETSPPPPPPPPPPTGVTAEEQQQQQPPPPQQQERVRTMQGQPIQVVDHQPPPTRALYKRRYQTQDDDEDEYYSPPRRIHRRTLDSEPPPPPPPTAGQTPLTEEKAAIFMTATFDKYRRQEAEEARIHAVAVTKERLRVERADRLDKMLHASAVNADRVDKLIELLAAKSSPVATTAASAGGGARADVIDPAMEMTQQQQQPSAAVTMANFASLLSKMDLLIQRTAQQAIVPAAPQVDEVVVATTTAGGPVSIGPPPIVDLPAVTKMLPSAAGGLLLRASRADPVGGRPQPPSSSSSTDSGNRHAKPFSLFDDSILDDTLVQVEGGGFTAKRLREYQAFTDARTAAENSRP